MNPMNGMEWNMQSIHFSLHGSRYWIESVMKQRNPLGDAFSVWSGAFADRVIEGKYSFRSTVH